MEDCGKYSGGIKAGGAYSAAAAFWKLEIG
jgi:hypothetical protein